MTAPEFTAEHVAELMNLAVRGITILDPHRVYPLPQVAEMTSMSLKYLERECRGGRLNHVHQGNLRGMNRAQIAQLIASHSVGGDAGPIRDTDDELEQARAVSRQSGARRGRRAAA